MNLVLAGWLWTTALLVLAWAVAAMSPQKAPPNWLVRVSGAWMLLTIAGCVIALLLRFAWMALT